MKFEDDFKTALGNLPSKEKDKLILRLLKKDTILAKRLYFELVSSDNLEDRRLFMEEHLEKKIKRHSERFYSCGILMMEMRELSGDITEHVKVTKDKYGEISLNILLVQQVFALNHAKIDKESYGKAYKLCIYTVNKLFRLLVQIKSLHEDLQGDFNAALFAAGEAVGECDHFMNTAIHSGFDVNWLLNAGIPDDIKTIYQHMKAMGQLK